MTEPVGLIRNGKDTIRLMSDLSWESDSVGIYLLERIKIRFLPPDDWKVSDGDPVDWSLSQASKLLGNGWRSERLSPATLPDRGVVH